MCVNKYTISEEKKFRAIKYTRSNKKPYTIAK